jgi:hypothetical protein
VQQAALDQAGAAAALLEDLADRALRSQFEPVLCLEAPEAVDVPRSLLRADGRSVYQRHGGVRYATRAQLAMEERMLAQARGDGAPRLTRADAARALGAAPARFEGRTGWPRTRHVGTRTRTGAAPGPGHGRRRWECPGRRRSRRSGYAQVAAISAVMDKACSASRRLGQAVAGQGVGPAQRVGQPVPAGHLPDKAGGVGAGHPGGGDVQRPG